MNATAAERMVVGQITKNKREVIKVTLEEWHGRRIVNVRVYFRAEDGEMRPSRKGLALSVDRLPDLVAVLTEAIRAASPPWRPAA